METNAIQLAINESALVETKELILSTKSSACILLNGDFKSRALYNLKDFIDFEGDKTIEYVTVSVPYATVPNSMYNINNQSNTLIVLSNSVTTVYTFPNGNHTYVSFMSAFQTVMPAQFSITYNAVANKFTITNSTAAFSLLTGSKLDYVVGFSGTVSSSNTAPYTLVMPRVINFLPTPIINLCCDQINNGQNLGINSNAQFSNILASIPNVSKLNNEIVYQNVQDEFVIKNVSHNNLTISILDDDGNFIDFNGVSSWFLLRFKIHKRINVIKGSFNDFLTNATSIRSMIEPPPPTE